uniref:LRR binding FLII interacting protein 1 n=1 Tax=Sparus aurata TaxID=8175 RepID=A0A671VBL7_SPAAU
MGTQGTGRKRSTKKERSTAEDDALNLIAREAEARLAAKRAARAEAREIRMKELERQQKEIFQVQKKYYGLDTKVDDRSDSKWGDIEQWMEDSERYSRSSRIQTHSDDDERMSVGSRGSVRVEDRDYLEKGSRAASALTAGTLTSLGGSSSRRGSGETAITVDAETSIREIKEIHELKDQIQDVELKYTQNLKEAKDALTEVEEKYRKAMVSNAQLDNEKNNLMYQVDTLKDSLMELEELLSESQRGYEEKVKEFEREKYAHSVLQFQFNEMKETLKQSEELLNALERQKEYTDAIRIERDELREEVVTLKDILKKHGIVLGPDLNINGDIGVAEVDGSPSADPSSQPAPDSQTTPTEGNSMLEIRLRKLVDEREKMIEQVKKLKAQLEQKTQKNGTESNSSPDGEILENGTDPNIIELQRDSNRQISDLKFKLVKAEQEVTALEQNVTRLEGQVVRYKSAAENAEKVEDELKAEKRKMQRELRSALDKVDELESNNSHLSKRLEKMKSSRGMAQTP